MRSVYFGLLILTIPFALSTAQETTGQNPTETINLFLDCRGCDEQYIQTEIAFVNFVRDKSDADVHLLVTRQNTASGGDEFTLQYIGKREFDDQQDTLKYISNESDTEAVRRKGMVQKIKSGLLPYVSQTEMIYNLDVSYPEQDEQQDQKKGKWNNWIFEIGVDSYFDGEESRKSINLFSWASARRITKDWKIRFNFNKEFNRRSFTNNDTTEVFITESNGYEGLIARSLNDHWSLGLFTEAFSSTRNNYDLRTGASPAIEFNIFPYPEYAQREISFRYGILVTYNNYDEITIFNKYEEFLLQNRLSASLEFTQPWGDIEGDIEAYYYMRDWSKNRLAFDLELGIQVTKGLSLNLSGRYSLINDQLAIPAGDISEEEQLLNLREQATSYYYGASIGIEYSFGSIYNNVVNPRF